jgi:hypothetical protein
LKANGVEYFMNDVLCVCPPLAAADERALYGGLK